jgi:hypothetical protein
MQRVIAVRNPAELLNEITRAERRWEMVTSWYCRNRGELPGVEAVSAGGVLHRIELDESVGEAA